MPHHPPPPGPPVAPNLAAIEEAVRNVTFPISKRDMMDQFNDEDTVVMNGRNVDVRTLVKDLPDDFFESEDEFRRAVEEAHAGTLESAPEMVTPSRFGSSGVGASEGGSERGQPPLQEDED